MCNFYCLDMNMNQEFKMKNGFRIVTFAAVMVFSVKLYMSQFRFISNSKSHLACDCLLNWQPLKSQWILIYDLTMKKK